MKFSKKDPEYNLLHLISNMSDTSGQIPVNQELKQRIASLYSYLAKHLGIKTVPRVVLTKSKKNAENPFGMTGHYDQDDNSIHIHTQDRHDTDILRTFAHEVIHHWQRERGTLTPQNPGAEGHYAQEDPNLRKREMEAYLFGNILFRDWQDENRMGPPAVQPFLPQPLNENLDPATITPEFREYAQVFYALLGAWAVREFYRLWVYPEFRQKIKSNWQLIKNDAKKLTDFIKNKTLNENLMLNAHLKNRVANFVRDLVSSGILSSYHRAATSGDMQANDFAEDLTHDVLSAIERWVQTVNNRGDMENQEGGMIK